MTPIWTPGPMATAFIAAAVLAVVLFAAASRWGRWSLWTAAYAAVLLALALALAGPEPGPPPPGTADPAGPADLVPSQESAPS